MNKELILEILNQESQNLTPIIQNLEQATALITQVAAIQARANVQISENKENIELLTNAFNALYGVLQRSLNRLEANTEAQLKVENARWNGAVAALQNLAHQQTISELNNDAITKMLSVLINIQKDADTKAKLASSVELALGSIEENSIKHKKDKKDADQKAKSDWEASIASGNGGK